MQLLFFMEDKMTTLEEFRAEKDAFFAKEQPSPLTPEQKREFHGLNYFPENPELSLEVKVEKISEKEKIVR